MHDPTQLSAVQKLLVAALDLAGRGLDPFTAEALTVAAWKLDPARFGLKGFKDEFPCSNSTFTNFMGDRGMVARGYLEKVGKKLYTLTPAGREEAKRAAGGTYRKLPTVRLHRDAEDRLAALLLSVAVLRFRGRQQYTLNWTHAAAFWAFGTPDEIDGLVDEARRVANSRELVLSSGQVVSHGQLDELLKVNAWLVGNFGREVEKRKAVTA